MSDWPSLGQWHVYFLSHQGLVMLEMEEASRSHPCSLPTTKIRPCKTNTGSHYRKNFEKYAPVLFYLA